MHLNLILGACLAGLQLASAAVHQPHKFHHAKSEWNRSNNTGGPVDARGVGPGKPEKSDGEHNATDNAHWQTRLGSSITDTRGLNPLHVLLVVEQDDIHNRHEDAHSHSDEGKTADTFIPVTVLSVDNGKSTEKHVENTIDDSVVEREQENDGLGEQQNPGALEAGREGLTKADLALVDIGTGPVNLSSQFGELLCTSPE